MSIGIGVLCCTQPNPPNLAPDAMVMISDTMGSTDTDSLGELHKMLFDPEHKLFSVCAGRVEMAAELFPLVKGEIGQIAGPRSHGSIWRALNTAVTRHRRERFMWDVVNVKYAVFNEGQIATTEHQRLMMEWRKYDTGMQALVGVFDDEGMALLYFLGELSGQEGLVHLMEFPGYFTVGSGSYNANGWLNYRGQTLGMSVAQSALHAYESSVMAASAPTVNTDIEVLIATAKDQFHLSGRNPSNPGCPISISWLRSMAKRYGARRTDALGFRGQPSSPTSS